MIDRDATPEEVWSAADWLRRAAAVLRRNAHDATPGPWRWGDPAVRRRDDDREPVLPGLRDPLDLFEEAVGSVSPRVHANARWIAILNPSIAEPLASLLDALAENAEQVIDAGGSVDEEPYRSAVVLAKRIVEAAEDWPDS